VFWKILGSIFVVIWIVNGFQMFACEMVSFSGGGRQVFWSCGVDGILPGAVAGAGIVGLGFGLLWWWWGPLVRAVIAATGGGASSSGAGGPQYRQTPVRNSSGLADPMNLNTVLVLKGDFEAAVQSGDAYRPIGVEPVPLNVDGRLVSSLSLDEQLDSVWAVTAELGFSRSETAALAALVLRSIDSTASVHGGIVRAQETLTQFGVRMDPQMLTLFSLAIAKWFRPEALAEHSAQS
jgi:hypothetical protein